MPYQPLGKYISQTGVARKTDFKRPVTFFDRVRFIGPTSTLEIFGGNLFAGGDIVLEEGGRLITGSSGDARVELIGLSTADFAEFTGIEWYAKGSSDIILSAYESVTNGDTASYSRHKTFYFGSGPATTENIKFIGSGVGPAVTLQVNSAGQSAVVADIFSADSVYVATKLRLPVKTNTGDPGSPTNGDIYVNTFDKKIRCYADGQWRDLATWF